MGVELRMVGSAPAPHLPYQMYDQVNANLALPTLWDLSAAGLSADLALR